MVGLDNFQESIERQNRQMKKALSKGVWGLGSSVNNKSKVKRSLGQRDRQILYGKGYCMNPFCKKKISYAEMQVGHKTAFSKGGNTTLSNSVCLCYGCNKLQGTDSWEKFLKKHETAKGQAKTRERKTSKPKVKEKVSKPKQDLGMLNYNLPKWNL